MGQQVGYICRSCGTRFTARNGGGFYFDLLHCRDCGATRSVGHQEMGEVHLRFIKGLKVPYAIVRMELDRQIQAEYQGEPMTKAEYHAAVEGSLEACACGGRFEYDAPPRCPACRSTQERWERDPEAPLALYD